MSDTEKDYEAIALAALVTAHPSVVAAVMGGPEESRAARVAAFGRGWDEAEQARQPEPTSPGRSEDRVIWEGPDPTWPTVGPDEEVQQPGTHRVTVRLEWQETNTYIDEVEIDVPDDFDGDIEDLLQVDDQPDCDVLNLPVGFQTHWLDRASFDPDSVDGREFVEITVID